MPLFLLIKHGFGDSIITKGTEAVITFQIQNKDESFSTVSHKEFYEFLKANCEYLYYKKCGVHIALLPSSINKETLNLCRQTDNAENYSYARDSRCRDEKGHVCRYQHDLQGHIIRNAAGKPISAKCGSCPRDGWRVGKRENCCISNSCKDDCSRCTKNREYHAPISLEWLLEDKSDYSNGAGFSLADSEIGIEAALEREELDCALSVALLQLPIEEQLVVRAIFWDNLSQRAYATKNGVSRRKVNNLYNSALGALKNYLHEFY